MLPQCFSLIIRIIIAFVCLCAQVIDVSIIIAANFSVDYFSDEVT